MTSDISLIHGHSLITIRIVLSTDSLSSPTVPPPLYLQIPRWSYTSSIAQNIWPHFHASVALIPSPNAARWVERGWFSFNSTPLMSNLPIGVLHDALVGSSAQRHNPVMIIWELELHYSSPPNDSDCFTVSWISGQQQQAILFSSLKEAAFIARGPDGCSSVMRMSGPAQENYWQAVCSDDPGKLRSSISSLKIVPCERQGAPPLVPIRIIWQSSSSDGGSYMTSRPWPARRDDGSWTTLGDVLSAMAHLTQQGVSWDGQAPQALIFGISPPLESPILWLHTEFHLADVFLYIVIAK